MATCSSILAWGIPWTDEPGKLQSMGLKKTQTRLSDSMQRVDPLEKTLMLGGIEVRRRGKQRMRWLDGITDNKFSHLKNEIFITK